ncbi:MAG: hypothetical protein WBF42_08775, partial [Terracidiphilus sp.]
FTLTQLSGPAHCSPAFTAATYPVSLGDIPTNGTASATFTARINGCNPNDQFQVSVPWSSATYDTGTFSTTINFR